MSFDLALYLDEHFPALSLEDGLFYRWPIGIRFDLGGRALTDDDFAEVNRRATSLFEAVFDPEDQCVVVAQDWSGRKNAGRFQSHLLSLSDFAVEQDTELGKVSGSMEKAQDAGQEEVGSYTLTWFEQLGRNFRYGLIMNGIANADHAREPALGGRIYFINPRTKTIMHMYDDRGLDLIAAHKSSLVRLYQDFNSWILDYDRAKIDAIFGCDGHKV